MRRRRYFVGLIAALVAAGSTMISLPRRSARQPRGNENMNPASESQMSGLIVTCLFDTKADAGTGLNINDYASAAWHSGAA